MLNFLLNPFSILNGIDAWIYDRFRAKRRSFLIGGVFFLTVLHFAGMLLYMGSSSILLFNMMFYIKISFEFLAYIAFSAFIIIFLRNFGRLWHSILPRQSEELKDQAVQFLHFLHRTNLYDFAIFSVLFIFVFPLVYFFPLWKAAFLTWAVFLSLILLLGFFIYLVFRSEPRIGQMANDVTKLVEDAGELVSQASAFLRQELNATTNNQDTSTNEIDPHLTAADFDLQTQRENIANVVGDIRALTHSLHRIRGVISSSLLLFIISLAIWVGYFRMETYLEANKMRVFLKTGEEVNLSLVLASHNGFLFQNLNNESLFFMSADQIKVIEILK